jgi:hypothetical protein
MEGQTATHQSIVINDQNVLAHSTPASPSRSGRNAVCHIRQFVVLVVIVRRVTE